MSMKLSTIPEHFSPEVEDRLGYLHLFDTVFLVDDSSSMGSVDKLGKPSRWDEARQMLAILAQIAAKHDQDGIDVHFLNNSKAFKGLKNSDEVAQVFQRVKPSSGTPMATKLDKILGEYFSQLECAASNKKRWFKRQKPVKPMNLIVITDGRPFPKCEEPDQIIREYMAKLDGLNIPRNKRQIGIMFAQVGHDRTATEHLQELDDMAQENERDMVDTFKCNLSDVPDDDIDTLAKLLLGAIVPEIDGMINAKFTSTSDANLGQNVVSSPSHSPPAYHASESSSADAGVSYDKEKMGF